jgi:hypothetical protein
VLSEKKCERQEEKIKLESKSSTTETKRMLSTSRVITPTLVYMAAALISDLGYAAHRLRSNNKNLAWKEGWCARTTVVSTQPMRSMMPWGSVIELARFIPSFKTDSYTQNTGTAEISVARPLPWY